MLVKTYGSAIIGVNAVTVTVEVTVSPGAGFSIVGLPDNAVKESGQRIASAFFESNFKIPNQNIVVNLAPADLKKEGSAYDLGIAMGQGSDIAIASAGVTLVSSDLSKIGELMRLSRRTVAVIRQNLFWAFFYNLLMVPLAAGALYPWTGWLLSPMVAAACMALSSVCVVSNSLRLRK